MRHRCQTAQPQVEQGLRPSPWHYTAFFFPAFAFAHLARCAPAIFLRADADMVRLGFFLPACALVAFLARGKSVVATLSATAFAQCAFCARLIRLRAEAFIV